MSRRSQAALLTAVLAVLGLTAYWAQAQTVKPSEAASAPAGKSLQIEGSTTVGPIAVQFVEAFKKLHPDVTITCKQTGSGDGAAALIDGRCQIATMSRFMKPQDEFKKAVDKGILPVAHAIAMDGVCIILHPSNPVKALTTAQVHDIYTGKITNWKELGGADSAIVVISRDTSSGTYGTFTEFMMGKDKLFEKAEYVNGNPQAHARVASTPGAIAYAGLGFVDDKVKAVTLNGVMPSRKTILSGAYLMSRPLFLFTNGYPALGSIEHEFCTFYLTEKGQQIVVAEGFVPLTNY
jgi:phosphate transport system substrate-binding protein